MTREDSEDDIDEENDTPEKQAVAVTNLASTVPNIYELPELQDTGIRYLLEVGPGSNHPRKNGFTATSIEPFDEKTGDIVKFLNAITTEGQI